MAKNFPDWFQPNNAVSYLNFKRYFNVDALWVKVATAAKKAGMKAIYGVLLLYYVAVDSSTPWKAKAVIYGALGYFIFPVDFIPDAVPLVGYSDDLTAIVAVVKAVYEYITPTIHERAFKRLQTWFPDVNHDEVRHLF